MRMHRRLSVTTILIGATVLACSKPPASGTRALGLNQGEVPATHPASVSEIPTPILEMPLRLETLPRPSRTQETESSSPTLTHLPATLPAGTSIAVRIIESIDSNVDPIGQTYRAVIDADTTADNRVVIPEGARARVKLTGDFPGHDFGQESKLGIELDRIVVGPREYTVSSGLLKRAGAGRWTATPAEVAIGSAADSTEVEQVIVVPSESRLTFRLEQPLEIEIDEPYLIPVPNRSTQSGPRKLGEQTAAVTTAAPESKINVSGEWNLLKEDHRGKRTVRLWLKQVESVLEGTIVDPTAGDLRLHGSVTGKSLRFSTESEIQGIIERSEFRGAIWSNRLAGTEVIRMRPKSIAPKFEGVPKMSASVRTYKWSAQRVKE